ncbi:MAG: hypothetical protein GY757_38655 [bacterium]|nr:hypothetical protein [bacterium]
MFEAHEHEGIPRPAQFGMELCFKERENKLGIIKGPNSSVPRFIRNPLPVYPKLAQKRNLTDLIEIEVITDIYGATRQARIKHGKHRILKKSALTAVKKWVHDHATLSGVPRPCIYTVLFRFHGKTKPFCVSTVFIKTDAAAYPLGKTQDETKVYVDARGNELSENDFFNDAKTGKIVTYFDSGASEEEGDKGAKGAGDDGAGKKYEESFLDGVRHGAFHGWYRSGKKRISGFFRKGKKDGTWTCWRENGKVLREGVY